MGRNVKWSFACFAEVHAPHVATAAPHMTASSGSTTM
eukprot:CAMPEP_0172724242 /NCGR_PEP_ID=MMETSP1074-20121228/85515_1 /TAXON_ID=2916 /ORGANISM="Ceratium fusus, Strain PA161109" /LENGTH=36 /DNA_ID= /DNA_START= /DNA_END= /DNA_ORIENTATION=